MDEQEASLQKKPTAGSCSAGVFWYWTEVSFVNHSGLSSSEDSEANESEEELDACLVFLIERSTGSSCDPGVE